MWPFHTWLPDAHVEAPTAGSVILAGVLLKLGGYGFIRFACRSSPTPPTTWRRLIIVLSLIAIIYGAIVAIVQPDLKKLVAYSSVSHMGFVTLGIFIFQRAGPPGRGPPDGRPRHHHGRAVPARRRHLRAHPRPDDRQDGRPRGAARRSTRRSSASSCWPRCGLPGLAGFVGEFLVLVGTFAVLAARRSHRRGRWSSSRRRVPAVDVPARRVRRAVRLPEGPRAPPHRHDPRRGPDARAAGRPDGRLRPLPGPRARPHRRARRRASWPVVDAAVDAAGR